MAQSIDFQDVMKIASAGMRAQGERLRVIAENIANANSLGKNAGDDPYRRRMVVFQNVLDKVSGLSMVKVAAVKKDMSPFERSFDPHNPMADAQGYVSKPNVNALIETVDMREAQRTYDANLSVLDAARSMIMRALDILRG